MKSYSCFLRFNISRKKSSVSRNYSISFKAKVSTEEKKNQTHVKKGMYCMKSGHRVPV